MPWASPISRKPPARLGARDGKKALELDRARCVKFYEVHRDPLGPTFCIFCPQRCKFGSMVDFISGTCVLDCRMRRRWTLSRRVFDLGHPHVLVNPSLTWPGMLQPYRAFCEDDTDMEARLRGLSLCVQLAPRHGRTSVCPRLSLETLESPRAREG